MTRKALALGVLIFASLGMFGQDIHFTQYYVSPFNLNPALVGDFDGDYRAIGQYRTQWRSITVPYNTVALAGDANGILPMRNTAAGASLYRDQAGDSRFTTTHFLLGGSYTIPMPEDSLQRFTIGLLTGVSHMGLDYSALNYDSQFSGGIFNPDLPPGESFARSSRAWWSNHLGVAYHYDRPNGQRYNGGLSFFNVTVPKQSLFDETGVRLDLRTQFHATAEIPINKDWDALPSTIVRFQGKHNEWLIGGRARYALVNVADSYRAVYGGLFWRTRDAGNLVAGLDVNQWQFGASYDLNLSQLREASNGRGGLELSVVYIWKIFKPENIKHRICPEYI